MYNRTNSVKKPSFNRGPSRFGGKKSFGGNRNRSRFADQKIDVSRYVNKNAVEVAVVPYVSKHAFSDFAIDARVKKNIGDIFLTNA